VTIKLSNKASRGWINHQEPLI